MLVTVVSEVITPAARNREMFSLPGKSSIATFFAMPENNPGDDGMASE
jgi:hypothetical protein